MKTTSRKRLLISSVAMLLVAMLALGTATYAWFTQNTQATADQLSVKTVKASELKLSKITGDWTDQLHYGTTGKVLKPASSADGTNWFTATAAAKNASGAKMGTVTKLTNTQAGLDGYVFKEQLNVANMGGAAVEGVKITFNLAETENTAGKKYLRLALVPTTKRGDDATVTEADFQDAKYIFGSDTDNANAIATATGTGTAQTITTKPVAVSSGASATVDVGTLTAKDTVGAAKYFNLYVWFEGQDTDCSDANAGNEMPPITFSVSGDTVAQN